MELELFFTQKSKQGEILNQNSQKIPNPYVLHKQISYFLYSR